MSTLAVTPESALRGILETAGLDPALAGGVAFTGADPVLPANFRLATAGAAAIAAVGVATSEAWRLRTGRGQSVEVDLREAAIALRRERYLRIAGKPPASPWADISGFYRTRDGRWIQYHCNFPHHREGVLRLLGARGTREAVAAATQERDAFPLEDALAAAGLCAAVARTPEEWRTHEQGRAVAALPLFDITKIASGPPVPMPPAERPLSGIRVLDLTRVLAGPTAGRTLAEHGADVMRITGPHLPALPDVDVDTGIGKLSAQLDLRSREGEYALLALAKDADVFLQAYRPGTLAGRGFSPERLARIRPAIVYASLSAYGHAGPWAMRRGYDTLVQSATGIVHEHMSDDRPRHLPASALDYVGGFLLAFAALAALNRRATEGGSYLVRVSLAQCARWLDSLGRVEGDARAIPDPARNDVAGLLIEADSPFGRLSFIRPPLRMSETPPRLDRPSVPLNHHPPAWP